MNRGKNGFERQDGIFLSVTQSHRNCKWLKKDKSICQQQQMTSMLCFQTSQNDNIENDEGVVESSLRTNATKRRPGVTERFCVRVVFCDPDSFKLNKTPAKIAPDNVQSGPLVIASRENLDFRKKLAMEQRRDNCCT